MNMLSKGCLSALMNGNSLSVDKPVVQILGLKKIPSEQERYRLSISDGTHSLASVMLATQLTEKMTSGELQVNAVIKIDRYVVNQVKDRKIIVILELTIIQTAEDAGRKYGNPVSLKKENDPAPSNFLTPIGKSISSTSNNSAIASPGRNIHPIASLNPYQNRWVIRARVTNKSNIRQWSNSRGEGKLFSVDLIDDSGEIRATAFNEQCDQYYDMITVNKIYYISKATLKNANKAFTSIKNDYEMSFHSGTEVEICNDAPDDLPVLQFDFVPINNMENLAKDSIIDVIGVCRSCTDLQTVVARNTGKEIQKRDMHLVDKSNTEIALTLWGETAEKHDGIDNPVIAVKGARLSEFNGRSVSALMSSVIYINPDIKEAYALRGWYDNEGANMTVTSISNKSGGFGGPTNWKTFAEVTDQGLGRNEKPDYYSVKATLSIVKHETAMYKACAGQECNKKVIDMNNGIFRCEKCNQEYSSFKWRILLRALLADFSGTEWVTFFQEVAETLIGMPADDLGNLKESSERNGNTDYLNRMNGICFQDFIFKLRTKLETYNEEARLKTIAVSVSPLNHAEYGKKLIADIKKLSV